MHIDRKFGLKGYNTFLIYTVLKDFETNYLGYSFKNKAYLIQAFVKDSPYLDENTENPLFSHDYQRLEFLGDSIIEIYVVANLYYQLKGASSALTPELF